MKIITTCVALLFMATTGAAQTGSSGSSQSSAMSQQTANTVKMDQFEQNRDQYIGKRVTLEAAVNNVLGPHLFTINDGNWFDFQGDTLVYLPAPLVGLITDDARVRVTGEVKRFTEVDLDREKSWLGDGVTIEAQFTTRPVLVANSIVSNQGVALAINMTGTAEPRATGTTGKTDTAKSSTSGKSMSGQQITDIGQLTSGQTSKLVGRDVKLSSAKVAQTTQQDRVWIQSPNGQERILVVAADGKSNVTNGQSVQVEGVVLQMPNTMRESLQKQGQNINDQIYVYASTIQKAS